MKWQHGKSKNSLSIFAKSKIDTIEIIPILILNIFEPSLIEYSSTEAPDILGSSFDKNGVDTLTALILRNRNRKFID